MSQKYKKNIKCECFFYNFTEKTIHYLTYKK